MKYTEETNNNQSKFKISLEISEADFIGLKMYPYQRDFIQKNLNSKNVSNKLLGLVAIVHKIEEKEIINLN